MQGYASAAMTLDTYAGLLGNDLDAVSDRRDEIRAKTVVRDLVGKTRILNEKSPEISMISGLSAGAPGGI